MQETRRRPPPWQVAAAAMAALLAFGSGRSSRRGAAARAGGGKPAAPPRGHRHDAAHPGGHDPAAALPDGKGHDAAQPSDIPARGWWSILKRTLWQASEDRLLTEAAGVTFYVLLALFPAIAALVSLYGLVADRATIGQHLAALSGIVPGGGMELIEEQVKRLASNPETALGFGALLGLALSLWSANQATKAVFDALNVVYEEKEKRSFVRLTLVTLLFTLGGIVFAVLALAAVVVLPVVLNFVGLGGRLEWLLKLSRWPLLLLGVALVLACLYRWGPSRAKARWRWVTWGSAVAALLWLAASLGFSWYVENFGSYNETYGSLGAVVGFMTWIWISSAVVLLGGELNAEMEHQTARDTTTGPEKPMGRRRARMADTVATE
ncbi:YihY/virulence factor BrkB family protein [Falsiroseomonas sp. CW058]|uniref:YihY/virulence factor BrkB family protein n=1 Tax=Falsiroseomonas sp. CW058 TaxID=3388664 RepID=UPI003D314F1B